MSDTEVDYLQPDFVPSSVTMPRLRSILVSQNVPYPATAKKAQLVEIFNDNVAPRARKLLAQRQKAKRSSMGITNIDGSQGYSVPNDDLRAPPSARRSRSPRKPTRSFKQESEEPEHIPEHVTLSPRKRQARSAGRQLAPSDTDTDSYYESTRSPRKPSRGAELTPKPERRRAESEEDGDVYQRRSNEPDTVFTSDNPFQSRTPSMPMTTPLNRRRTAGLESTIKRNASSSLRRRAERPQDDDYDSTVYSERFETPASMFTRPVTPRTPRSPQPLTVEAGEEFTPDEQLAMNQEDAERAQQAMVPVRQNKRSTGLTTPLWVFFMTLFGAYAAWYRQEKLAVGYCGVGRPEHDLIPRQLEYKDYKFDVPEWAFQLVEPRCEPCPPHAYCYVDGSVRCEDAFILKPHPLSAGGLVPLPPTCEPDGEKVRRVKAVADKAIEELRERQAKFECGELVDEDGHQSQTPMIAVDELKETVSDKRSKKLNKKEFDDLWAAALGEIETRDEIMIEHKDDSESDSPEFGSVSNTYLASSSLARLPLRCAVRRSVRLSLERNRLSIISVVLFFISALYGRSRYRSYRAMSAQVPALVDLVLGRLAAQKELAYEEGGEDDPFLFLPNLRDDVLRRVFSLSERERIWQRVKAVVEQNTNVRTGQREGNNGEVGRAWEWIGPSGTLENGTRRRKTGRGVSWGADVKELEEDNKSAIHKQWEEPGSRPMY